MDVAGSNGADIPAADGRGEPRDEQAENQQ